MSKTFEECLPPFLYNYCNRNNYKKVLLLFFQFEYMAVILYTLLLY